MSNTIIRRPSNGDSVSVGNAKFLATVYTQGKGPLLFQPTRSTSIHRGFKDKRHSSANRINSPMEMANMGLVSPPAVINHLPNFDTRERAFPIQPARRG